MIFDGEKKVYILSEQEYDEMFDGEAHANLGLIKVREQLADASKTIERLQEQIKEANIIIKKCSDYCSIGCYYDNRDEEMALDSKFYIKKWDVK